MMRHALFASIVAGLTSLAGCSAAPPPPEGAKATQGAALGPATDPAIPGEWRDIDALPQGARFRIGSRAMTGSDVVAIADDGTVASYSGELGIFEARRDGKVRLVPTSDCRPTVLRYVENDLLGICGQKTFRRRGRAVEVKPVPCDGTQIVLSTNGAWLACADVIEKTTIVVMLLASGET